MRACILYRLLFSVSLLFYASSVLAGTITVSAASSLSEVFKEISHQFEMQNPSIKVALNFGASGALLQQMTNGAPVDIFASADQETMNAAQKQGLVTAHGRRDFASNALVLVTPHDHKTSLQQLHHLTMAQIKRIAIGNPESVPVGRYAKHALEAVHLWNRLSPKWIFTQNAKQSLEYVVRGEVDAGFIYATDAALMKDKVRVACEIPLDQAMTYPIAQTVNSSHSKDGLLFLNFVTSPVGQAILNRYGFLRPVARS